MPSSSAPVYSPGDGQRARAESAAWTRFTTAAVDDDHEFCGSWLALLAARVKRTRAALLLIGEQENGPFTVAAAWPDPQRDLQYLGAVAQRTLSARSGLAASPDGGEPSPGGAAHVGYPIQVSGRLHGAVVFDIAGGADGDLQEALRQIHWASAWMADHFRHRALQATQAELARVAMLNELMATALQQRRLQASALAVANDLAARLSCDRVAVGFEQQDRITPLALSHTATFDRRSDLVRSLGTAMDEVLDLGVAVVVPKPADNELGAIAHQQAALALEAQAMLSVPLVDEGRTIGVITLERQKGPEFSSEEQGAAVAAGVMLGPVWALQRLTERSLARRVHDGWGEFVQALFGARNPGIKLFGALLGLVVVGLWLWQVDHRVSARTVIEGSTQRANVAPFDGFIAEGLVRAGDTVKRGQLMARLEDRDLKLERARWSAERDQLQRKYQVAMSQADRGAMGVIAAQTHQSEAQLALADDKLARARLVAPFDGVVVSGDLSQAIGTPVELGRTLFEVAPLEGYRVVLQVDDRDIARMVVGQPGELVLSSLTDQKLLFTLSSITSVATQHEGRNVFRVEAQLQGPSARLRPGMEGVGKVVVGERSLLWIWTHNFFDWLRLSLWAWMP